MFVAGRTTVVSAIANECTAFRRATFAFCGNQRLLDADHRHSVDLFAGDLRGGRHRRLRDLAAFDPRRHPRFSLPPIGAFIGLGFGILIAAPALGLDGFYYALLTLGLNELFRVFFTTSKQFGSASGGLYGAIFSSTKTGRHSPSRSSPTTLRWLC